MQVRTLAVTFSPEIAPVSPAYTDGQPSTSDQENARPERGSPVYWAIDEREVIARTDRSRSFKPLIASRAEARVSPHKTLWQAFSREIRVPPSCDFAPGIEAHAAHPAPYGMAFSAYDRPTAFAAGYRSNIAGLGQPSPAFLGPNVKRLS